MTQASNLAKGGTNFNSTGNLSLTTGVTGTLPIANGGTGSTSTTFVNLTTNVTGTLPAANGGTGATTFPSPGTSGNVLTSNGTVWTSAAAAAFDAGTKMLFQQTAAPTGWTKITTYNDYAIRIVSGTASTGGSSAFSTCFANQTPTITTSGLSAGATTLSTAQMPSHSHSISASGGSYNPCAGGYGASGSNNNPASLGNTGGGGSHTHSISGSATSSAVTLAVQYVDHIIASKN